MLLLMMIATGVLTSLLVSSIIYIVMKVSTNRKKGAVSVLAVMGSGGHTKEMLSLLSGLGPQYRPRCYVIAKTDTMSQQKVEMFEKQRQTVEGIKSAEYSVSLIPRSREVAQSWLSSISSTLTAIVYSFPVVFRSLPSLIVCNGPGTCVPICLVGVCLKILSLGQVKIVYVESICRVDSLSVSAWMLYYVVDHMLVQWPSLQKKYPRTQYIGKLV
uniref:UDP-N-acetylglucosamine transferase subunit ALG14 n=1 Tax=Crassostrea virginica TaxID=6565 RepID=A0A8B8CPK8_CRAVI|nr:UDP-N-acetylglucosamine transferase subunit ALG14 homolog [Crassostrea virginica]